MKKQKTHPDVLILNGIEIPLLITIKPKRNLSFRFIEGILHVSAPYNLPLTDIKASLFKKEAWILKHYALSKGKIVGEDEIRLHDRRMNLFFQTGSAFSYSIETEGLILTHPSRMKPENALARFKKEYSDIVLRAIFAQAVKETGLKPASLTIRDTKSSHGRCNSKKQITLSARLIAYDPAYIRYVCIHELAHLVHMNHSKDFYALVSRFCPEYKKLIAQVRSAVL